MPLPPFPLTVPQRTSSSANVTLSLFFSEYLDRLALGAGSATVSYHPYSLDEQVAVRTTSAEGSSGEGLRRDAQNTSQAMARE